MPRRNLTPLALMGGPSLWLAGLFVLPLILMAGFSFRPDMRGGLFSLQWNPTLEHYRTIVQGGIYLPLLWVSIRVAFGVALVATLLAYPLAYFLVFRAGLRAPLFLTLLILPFWTSYLLRIIAWKVILGTDGVVNSLLMYLGLVSDPVPILLYSRSAVLITLVYVWLPFVALPIYAALQRIDARLLEAATILGAPPWYAFVRVTLPLSLPGVLAGFVMVFIPTVGEYVTPLLVGGSRGALYGNVVELFFGDGINWPLGSALALIMLVGVLALFAAVVRIVDPRRFLG
jgi:spermidine/putrescine transport system permease protein